MGRVLIGDEARGRHAQIGVAAARTHDSGDAVDDVDVRDLVAIVIPVRRDFVAKPKIQSQIPRDLEIVLSIIGLRPTEEVVVSVAGGYFGIVTDSQEEGGDGKAAAAIERRGGGHGKVIGAARQVVR